MASPAQADLEHEPLICNPWPSLIAALVLAVLGFALSWGMSGAWPVFRLALFLLALLAAGVGVIIRPRAPEVVASAAFIGLVVYWGLDFDSALWDSAQLVVGVFTAVAAVAAIILFLPRAAARAVVSVLLLLHFGGILTAVLSVPPREAEQAWVANWLWLRVYRPYLQFAYLNNAYHFYSPEPGPASLLWARVEYDDGSSRWYKVPNREEHWKDPLGQEYYRRLSLTDTISHSFPTPAVPDLIKQRRVEAGSLFPAGPIPLHPYMADTIQFKVPIDSVRKTLTSYARFIARHTPHPDDPNKKITSVKMYRIIHNMMAPADFLRPEMDPLHRVLFVPYFLGDFDVDGNLKNPTDPFLYWMIPIIPKYDPPRTDALQPFRLQVVPDPRKAPITGIYDCLTLHAGSSPWGGDR